MEKMVNESALFMGKMDRVSALFNGLGRIAEAVEALHRLEDVRDFWELYWMIADELKGMGT